MPDDRIGRFEDRNFLLLVVVTTLAFIWVLHPFFSAILWGVIAAIVFAGLHGKIERAMPRQPSLAAFVTLLAIIFLVLIPTLLILSVLGQEAATVYARFRSGEIDVAGTVQRIQGALPAWITGLQDRLGTGDLTALQQRLTSSVMSIVQSIAGQAVGLGKSVVGFVVALLIMLYLTFFLLRDGNRLAERFRAAVPLRADRRDALLANFITVVRATIKGGVLVALAQGAVAGVIFWALGIRAPLLCGVLVALSSLLPAVGSGLVWGPIALYLLLSGSVWQGVVLILCGFFVIGMVDNVLRPMLVGRDTRMPDYVVLLSTLGGIEIFGLSGFVIGPVIAAMFIAEWQIFTAARQEALSSPS